MYGSAVYAGIEYAGTSGRRYLQVFSSILTLGGGLTKRVGRVLAATMSLVGTITLHLGVLFLGVLSFSGATTRAISSSMSGTLAFIGTINRNLLRTLGVALLSFVGNISRLRLLTFLASLSLSGVLIGNHIIGRFVKYIAGIPKIVWTVLTSDATWSTNAPSSEELDS